MKKTQNLTNFMKKNAVFLVMALCIIAIGFSIVYMLLPTENQTNNPPDVDVVVPTPPEDSGDLGGETPVDKPIEFIMPVASPTSISEFSETMVWSSTMSRYSSHMAIDFFAPEGTSVLAVMDGVVEKVENDLLKGYSVTIDHGNGLKTVYNSLADGDLVYQGMSVKAGDIIGEVSVSNRQEYKDGAHLHFETLENGVSVNPEKYLMLDNK